MIKELKPGDLVRSLYRKDDIYLIIQIIEQDVYGYKSLAYYLKYGKDFVNDNTMHRGTFYNDSYEKLNVE